MTVIGIVRRARARKRRVAERERKQKELEELERIKLNCAEKEETQ